MGSPFAHLQRKTTKKQDTFSGSIILEVVLPLWLTESQHL